MPNEKIALFFSKLEMKLNELSTIVGEEVVNYANEAFDKQAWDGVEWEPLKNKKAAGRNILVKSGFLKSNTKIISHSPSSVIVGNLTKYAAIHNNGGIINRKARQDQFVRPRYVKGNKKGAFRKITAFDRRNPLPGVGIKYGPYTINMPRRRFLGINPELKERIKQRVLQELKSKP